MASVFERGRIFGFIAGEKFVDQLNNYKRVTKDHALDDHSAV
jgi:hypothetical protein